MSQPSIPSQVEEAANMAEKLFEQMNRSTTEEKQETDSEEVEEETSEETSDEPEEDLEEEEEPEVEVEEEEIDPKELKKWRDRYLTLKGKYNAEVPRLASQLKELQEQLIKPSVKESVKEVVNPEEDEDSFESVYGTEFVENIRKLINQTVKQEIQPVTDKVDLVETTQRNDATESFKAYLDENAEGWRDLWEGKDKGFQSYLKQPDPSGLYTNGELLELYNNAWDADKMVKLFKLYKNETVPNTKQKESLTRDKEAMIAPSRSKTTPEPTSKEKKVWTNASMKEFEQADRLGKYSDEESQAMWADLLAAANEGRIR